MYHATACWLHWSLYQQCRDRTGIPFRGWPALSFSDNEWYFREVADVYVERAISCSRVAVRRAPSSRPPIRALSTAVGLAGGPVRAQRVILVTRDDCGVSNILPTPSTVRTLAKRVFASDLVGAFDARTILCGLGPRAGSASCGIPSAPDFLEEKTAGHTVRVRLTCHVAFSVQALDLVAHTCPAARVAGGTVRVGQLGQVPLGPPAPPRRYGPARLRVGRGDLDVFLEGCDGGNLADFDNVPPCVRVNIQPRSIHTQLTKVDRWLKSLSQLGDPARASLASSPLFNA